MIEFRDDQGRPWMLALTVGSALRVRDTVSIDVDREEDTPDGGTKRWREAVPFDLIDVGTISQTFQVLRSQYAKIGEVLYAILLQQIAAKGLTKDDFLDGLRGDSLEAATKALEQELVSFFPSRLRKMIGKMSEKMSQVQDEMLGRAEAQMDAATVDDLSGMQSGKPLESSAVTPASGPSANSGLPETPA